MAEQEEKRTIMGIILSIVVPIYKVESYLSKCIDSLLNQDVSPEDYEIILVDDGSPDRCGEICDEYASRYANIKVVRRKNGGLSAARNSGIDVAQGKYIQFVDSDDNLEPNVLKTLVEKMEDGDLEVLRFNYQNVNEKGEVIHPNKDPKRFVDYSEKVCDGLTFLNERLGPACYAVQFLIRRELLKDCSFKEGIYFEDTEWTPRMLLKAKRASSTELVVYNYLMRVGSITKSVDEKKKKKLLNDQMALIDSLKNQMDIIVDKRWFEGMIAQIATSIICYVSENYYDERKTFLSELKKKKVFPLSTYMANKTCLRRIKIANISSNILCFILRLRKILK